MSDGPTPTERFIAGILPENPIYRQLLGLCPTLAVTNNLAAALTMAGATAFVLFSANLIISGIRHLLQPHLRILVFTLTIATFVTVVDRVLAAYLYQMSKELGPYIPLIIVNCLIVSRCEICASKQAPLTALGDAAGQSLGFALGLASIAAFRELLGAGSLFGFEILPESIWARWTIMVLPPGAFFALGLLLGLVQWMALRRKNKAQHTGRVD